SRQGPDGTSVGSAGGIAGSPPSGVSARTQTERASNGSPAGYVRTVPGGQPGQSSGSTNNPSGAPQPGSPTGNENPIPVDPESDRRPPVLEYLRFDPPEIPDGGVTTLSVGAVDDLSGVKTVYGVLR